MATLTYAYAESTAVVGPLAPSSEPHSWDLCAHHSERITAPLGWEMLRVEGIEADDDEELTALAEAVREAGRFSTGLVAGHDPRGEEAAEEALSPQTSLHPVHRSKRLEEEKQRRRAHLRVVRDGDER